MWEWLFGGEDDKNVFDNIGDWWTGDDDDDDYAEFSESAFAGGGEDLEELYNNILADPNYGREHVDSYGYDADDPFAWLYEEDPEFIASVLGDDWMGDSQYGWNEDETSYIFPDESEDDYDGIFGLGIGPWLNQAFTGGEGLLGFLGGGGNRPGGGGGIAGLLSSLAGGTKNMLDNDLVKMLLAKKLLDDDREGGSAGYVPIGQEAYGGGSPLPDYRISNIQPALLPGMAYANQPTTFNNMPPPTAPPPGMQAGGIASLENRMEGPGDVTQAMLEPGEFVMTRKATQNLTPEYLYSLMHQAENAGRMR
tara:strand:- start:225 stop:1148 length:924 start_codon:yes stop_codon:yes gene_type:complete